MAVRFRVAYSHKQLANELPNTDLSDWVVLERSLWNDHDYLCTFRVFVYPEGNTPFLLGEWKILDPGSTAPSTTELPHEFDFLPAQFVSLGQTISAYERLKRISLDRRQAILTGLRDLLLQPLADIEESNAFKLALARFSEAREVLRNRARLLRRIGIPSGKMLRDAVLSDRINLNVRALLQGFEHSHEFRLSFSRRRKDVGLLRTVILVGENGTGKTQLLAALARTFSGLEREAAVVTPTSPFSVAIAVSYGALDRFTRPRGSRRAKSYFYCGLRSPDDGSRLVIDVDAAIARTQHSIGEVLRRPKQRVAWTRAMRTLGLVDLAKALTKNPLKTRVELRQLSAGWQIAAMSIADLSATLREGAIVLYDEPETHLHPRLLSALLRALRQLLEAFDAYAIIATHSLIPVQETPKSSIVVLRNYPEAGVIAGPPARQSFASPLDDIERDIFGARQQDVNYQALLEHLVKSMSQADIEQVLGHDLGLGARLALAGLKK
jgi:predicted ATPase